MRMGSVDEKVVVYGSGSFVMGVVQTRDYCTALLGLLPALHGLPVERRNLKLGVDVSLDTKSHHS